MPEAQASELGQIEGNGYRRDPVPENQQRYPERGGEVDSASIQPVEPDHPDVLAGHTWPFRTRVDRTIRFDDSGDAEGYLAFGWWTPEPTHTWSTGKRSALVFPTPDAPFGYYLEIDAGCFIATPDVPAQSLVIWANDRRVATLSLRLEGTFVVFCPPPRGGERQTILTFEHRHAARPCDFGANLDNRELALSLRRIRILPLTQPLPDFSHGRRSEVALPTDDLHETVHAAERLSGLPVAELATSFEVLAGDCWFGLMQRVLGLEPLSLLRFAGATALFAIDGLNDGFRDIDVDVRAVPAGDGSNEWMLRNPAGLSYHSGKTLEISPESVLKSERVRLRFLRGKLLSDLETPNKVFIFHDRRGAPREDAVALFLALRRTGAHRMLWVRHDTTGRAGAVEEIADGLFEGRLNPIGGPIIEEIPIGGWLTVLTNAARLAFPGGGQ